VAAVRPSFTEVLDLVGLAAPARRRVGTFSLGMSQRLGIAAALLGDDTPVRIGVGTVGPRAVLEVADNGPGLTEAETRHVFDRFYRVDAARVRSSGGGAGLGLAIVWSLVTAHGGSVQVSTGPGEGATFRVTLPVLADHQDD
jgi:two-component system, OmpR family, sensor kinase